MLRDMDRERWADRETVRRLHIALDIDRCAAVDTTSMDGRCPMPSEPDCDGLCAFCFDATERQPALFVATEDTDA